MNRSRARPRILRGRGRGTHSYLLTNTLKPSHDSLRLEESAHPHVARRCAPPSRHPQRSSQHEPVPINRRERCTQRLIKQGAFLVRVNLPPAARTAFTCASSRSRRITYTTPQSCGAVNQPVLAAPARSCTADPGDPSTNANAREDESPKDFPGVVVCPSEESDGDFVGFSAMTPIASFMTSIRSFKSACAALAAASNTGYTSGAKHSFSTVSTARI
jgi:hypothetical protein